MIIESSSCAVLQDEVGLIARTTDQRLYPHDVPRFVLSSLVEKNLGPSVDDEGGGSVGFYVRVSAGCMRNVRAAPTETTWARHVESMNKVEYLL